MYIISSKEAYGGGSESNRQYRTSPHHAFDTSHTETHRMRRFHGMAWYRLHGVQVFASTEWNEELESWDMEVWFVCTVLK